MLASVCRRVSHRRVLSISAALQISSKMNRFVIAEGSAILPSIFRDS
jgi:hypothetical protein